jgi:putative inorganic carbon (hco3(-)) transporter
MSLLPQAEWWRPKPVAAIGSEWPTASVAASRATGSRLAFRALLAFTFILVLAPQSFIPALQVFRIALLAAAVGIAAQLVHRVVHGGPVTVLGREMALVAGLVAWSVVTIPWSFWPGGSVSFLLNVYLKTVAIFWLLANTVDSVDRLQTLAWSLTLMAVPLALTGLKNFMSGEFLGANRILGYEAGLTANPNDLALMLNLLLPLGVALLLSSRRALARSVLVVVVLLEASTVIVTFSRAGFLSLATCVALYLWRLVRRGLTGWVLAGFLACVVGLTLLPGSYIARLATITDIDSDPTGSAQSRWEDTQAAVRYVMANPVVGAGIGMDTEALNGVRGITWTQVHNICLEYAVDLGLPGLALFVLLFVSCVRRLRHIHRAPADDPAGRPLSCLAEGIEIALLSFGIGALFAPVAYLFYFYYLAGLAVAAGAIHRRLVAVGGSEPGMASAS